MISDQKLEQKINELIDQGRKDQVVKLIYELIVRCAGAGQFERAENLREKLIQMNPMALDEIINSAEIIDSEKSKAIDTTHKATFAALYDRLTAEETNALYFSMKKLAFPSDRLIIQQDKLNNRLFLVDEGKFKVICTKGQEEIFLKQVGKSEPVGLQTFFSITLATHSVISSGPVVFHYLEREAFKKITEKFPGFESKLAGICSTMVKEKVEDVLKKKKMERRRYQRRKCSGKVAVHWLNATGEPSVKPFYGLLEDLSRGGISFSIQSSTRESARMFLGRKALVHIPSRATGSKATCKGRMISVYDQLFNHYAISFKFDTLLSSEKVRELADTD